MRHVHHYYLIKQAYLKIIYIGILLLHFVQITRDLIRTMLLHVLTILKLKAPE